MMGTRSTPPRAPAIGPRCRRSVRRGSMRRRRWTVFAWLWSARSGSVGFASVVAAVGNFVRLDGGVGTERGNRRSDPALCRIQAGKILAHGMRQGIDLAGAAVDFRIDGIGIAARQTLGHGVQSMHAGLHAGFSGG